MNRRGRPILFTLGCLLALSTVAGNADDYELDWCTIDGGGEMWCTGGHFELSGTIGQPDDCVMTGGDFELTGGFWANCACFGDLDGDCEIDLSDLARLLSNYGTTSGMTYQDGDLDCDGDVDLPDLAALLAVYGTACE